MNPWGTPTERESGEEETELQVTLKKHCDRRRGSKEQNLGSQGHEVC